jgi:hypothetical protein
MLSPAPIEPAIVTSREQFEVEILAAGEPRVLRGFASNFPIVRAAADSDAALVAYLRAHHNGSQVPLMTGAPDIDGRLFYGEDLQRLNFQSRELPLADALHAILVSASQARPSTIYIGSASTAKHWPDLAQANPNAILPNVLPNLWIGNRAVVGPHNDFPDNIACVVAGRRRFRVFPPEQFANLYIGPLELNPAGRPVSFVSVTEPELERYPQYSIALAASREAELEPGDAIYIPSQWWHSVESLAPFNVLMNYWWTEPGVNPRLVESALLHSLMAIGPLSDRQRAAWKAVFDHLVFRVNGDPVAHIPPQIRGALGTLTPDLRDRIRTTIRHSLLE